MRVPKYSISEHVASSTLPLWLVVSFHFFDCLYKNLKPFPKHFQVRAGESLLKLVSDIKEFLILNNYPGVNESIDRRCKQLHALQKESQSTLNSVKEDLAGSLYELEEEYYNSYCKTIIK